MTWARVLKHQERLRRLVGKGAKRPKQSILPKALRPRTQVRRSLRPWDGPVCPACKAHARKVENHVRQVHKLRPTKHRRLVRKMTESTLRG